jgi:hypothetical protein
VIIGLKAQSWRSRQGFILEAERLKGSEGGSMAKRHGRPSVQYRYEHYDPRM